MESRNFESLSNEARRTNVFNSSIDFGSTESIVKALSPEGAFFGE